VGLGLMHKLTAIEAQRVLAVIQEGLDGLNFLSYVPTRYVRSARHKVEPLLAEKCLPYPILFRSL
jgi:hypothetical protein